MGVVPFDTDQSRQSVILRQQDFRVDRAAILIIDADMAQLADNNPESNASYDLRVGRRYRDHRDIQAVALQEGDTFDLLPGDVVIIETEEEVRFPTMLFGQILPKVSLLQLGVGNTPTKIDPGYHGPLLITTFHHGRRPVQLKRQQRLCSLHLMTVDPPARPYNKRGKSLLGE